MTNLNKDQTKTKDKTDGTAQQQFPSGQGQRPTQAPKVDPNKMGYDKSKNRDRDDSGQAR